MTLLAVATAIGACVLGELRTWTHHQLTGPMSPSGHRAILRVSDCLKLSIGADFYADVDIVDSTGKAVFRWEDPSGQESYSTVKKLVASMKWQSYNVLKFECSSGIVEIRCNDTGKWSAKTSSSPTIQ